MGTTEYFNEQVKGAASEDTYHLEVGTTNFAGEGPQMYLQFDGGGLILSHEDAKDFFQAMMKIGHYFGYPHPDLKGHWVLRRT